ncbi:hypothetical protein [Zavarzinia compransoris]|uniref:Peptidase C39-like domain-containing protein n=1 Tax=Zavarzinia compransoris TaxID=1264899 RepID=A0A317E4Z4_9PROT|nr:hypothetical protein [Zavarzinia compransoris]PWR22137.1 hypothetical protein DKG75_09200 [Zavarzinia compransoris]TDP47113.1 hypothetical protein DES42_103283 [Zavarzinia compransoris]
MANYRQTAPIGQFDPFACWAASTSWWLKALGGGRPALSQMDLISQYTRFCDDSGGLPHSYFMNNLAKEARFMMRPAYSQSSQWANAPMPLGDRPVIVVFNYPLVGGTHMNVIFDQNKETRTVTAMEPFHPHPGTDGQRTGRFVERPESFYLSGSPVIGFVWAK